MAYLEEDDEGSVTVDLAERVKTLIAAAESTAQALEREADERARARAREAEETARAREREAEEAAERVLDDARREVRRLADDFRGRSAKFVEAARDLATSVGESHRRLESVLEELESDLRRTGGDDDALGAGEPTLADETLELPEDVGEAESADARSDAAAPRYAEGQAGEDVDGDAPAGDGVHDEAPAAPRVDDDGVPGESSLETGVKSVDEEEARFVALRMAAAGKSRREVAHHLQDNFRIAQLEAVLASVFGPKTDADE